MTARRWAIDASTGTLMDLSAELQSYYRSRVRDTREAEDLVGQTWLAAGRTFEGRCTLRYYLYSIARRLVSNRWRRLDKRPWLLQVPTRTRLSSDGSVQSERIEPDDLTIGTPDLMSELSSRVDARRLDDAIARIPDIYREPVELVLQGYGFVEMAQMLGVEYNTIRSRYARGKARLKQLISEEAESDWDILSADLELDEGLNDLEPGDD